MRSLQVLGSHRGEEFFDAIDVVLDTDAGPRVLGVRTAGYVEHPADTWDDGYSPVAMTFDPAAVGFWDFGSVLWLGPDPHPCLVWSNAAGISLRGMRHLVAPVGSGAVLAGPGGRGLPTPEQLGVAVPADAPSYPPLTL